MSYRSPIFQNVIFCRILNGGDADINERNTSSRPASRSLRLPSSSSVRRCGIEYDRRGQMTNCRRLHSPPQPNKHLDYRCLLIGSKPAIPLINQESIRNQGGRVLRSSPCNDLLALEHVSPDDLPRLAVHGGLSSTCRPCGPSLAH